MLTSELLRFTGLHLRVCAVPFLPVMRIDKDANGTAVYHSGVNVELFDYLAQALQWTYTFVNVNDDDLINFGPQGSCFHLLNLNKVDVSAVPTPLKPEFYKLMDVIDSPLSVSDFRLIVPWPKEQKTNHLLATVQPFQPTVWLCLIIIPIVILVFMKILTIIYSRIDSNLSLGGINTTLTNPTINILLNRGNWNPFQKTSLRLIIGIWCLITLVLLSAYGSILTSFLTVRKLEPIVNSLEELAGTRQPLKLIMLHNTPMEQRFLVQEATEGVFKKLGDSFRENHENCVSHQTKMFEKMLPKPLYTMIAADSQSYPFIYSTYKSSGMNKCKFTLSKILPQLAASYHYYTLKNGPYTEPVNKKWQILWDSGILKFWADAYKPHIEQCLLNRNRAQKSEGKSISLKQLNGAFTILGLGLSLSVLIFALEGCWFSYRRFVNSALIH